MTGLRELSNDVDAALTVDFGVSHDLVDLVTNGAATNTITAAIRAREICLIIIPGKVPWLTATCCACIERQHGVRAHRSSPVFSLAAIAAGSISGSVGTTTCPSALSNQFARAHTLPCTDHDLALAFGSDGAVPWIVDDSAAACCTLSAGALATGALCDEISVSIPMQRRGGARRRAASRPTQR